jgi:hypothetical protein
VESDCALHALASRPGLLLPEHILLRFDGLPGGGGGVAGMPPRSYIYFPPIFIGVLSISPVLKLKKRQRGTVHRIVSARCSGLHALGITCRLSFTNSRPLPLSGVVSPGQWPRHGDL